MVNLEKITVEEIIKQKKAPEDWVNLREAAAYCKVSYGYMRSIYPSLVKHKVFTYRPFGRPLLSLSELKQFIKGTKVN